jgi:transcriptional regulator with XRE-family HTH domain
MPDQGDRLRETINKLIHARREQRLSQEEIAYRIGVDQPTLSAYERQARQVSAGKLLQWIEALGYGIEITQAKSERTGE